jgi:hypothetical protein
MNALTSKNDTWWATYLKATVFLIPPLMLWTLSVIFAIPKIQQICADVDGRPLPDFLRMMLFLTNNSVFLFGALVVMVGLLEWGSDKWARYRGIVTGVGVFVFNSVILSSLFVTLVTLLVVAPGLARLGK